MKTLTAKKLAHIEKVRTLLANAETDMRDLGFVRCGHVSRSTVCRLWARPGRRCSHCRANALTHSHGRTRKQIADHAQDRRVSKEIRRAVRIASRTRRADKVFDPVSRGGLLAKLGRMFRGGDR